MHKHTKGQWLVADKESNDQAYEGRTIYSECGRICDLTILRPAHENAANARLIIDAPELLQLVRELYEEGLRSWKLLERAASLIARIEGEDHE